MLAYNNTLSDTHTRKRLTTRLENNNPLLWGLSFHYILLTLSSLSMSYYMPLTQTTYKTPAS